MKRILTFIFLTSCMYHAKAVTAYFSVGKFYSQQDGNYVETYLSTVASTLSYAKNANGKYQASMDISILFLKGDSIINAKKYFLNSPEGVDSNDVSDFLDLQRFVLKPGKYTIELNVADKRKPADKFTTHSEIEILSVEKNVLFSDIIMVDKASKTEVQNILSKSGLDIIPICSNFFDDKDSIVKFYGEVYNASEKIPVSEKYLIAYHLENDDNKQPLNDYASFVKMTSSGVSSFFQEIKIAKLASGNYNLVVELRNKNNEVLATSSKFFQRKKSVPHVNDVPDFVGDMSFEMKIHTKDSLVYYIKSFWPVSSKVEREMAERIIAKRDEKQLRNYIHEFWFKKNNSNPEAEWHKYNTRVMETNSMFGTQRMNGFRTDRGRVYLQYGVPDKRGVYENEPSNFPYEIWQYYTIGKYRNRKFVFYNPYIATNQYVMLHSDMVGETRNDNWKVDLDSRTHNGQQSKMNLDNTQNRDYFGNNAEDNFNNPR